jgi:IS1 family transposase
LLPAEPGDVLELDEIWTFVGSKENRIWIWIALCRRTRQVVAWMRGDHSTAPCRHLKHKIPPEYQGCFCYADEWSTYAKVFPDHRLHQQEVKGPTNHLERFNLTLRQRLSRLIRKALSFSKSLKMHLICLRRFFLRYNLDQAAKYLKSLPE